MVGFPCTWHWALEEQHCEFGEAEMQTTKDLRMLVVEHEFGSQNLGQAQTAAEMCREPWS